MYAARIKKTLDILDGDTSVRVIIRKLNAKSLEKARDAQTLVNAGRLKAFSGDVLSALKDPTKVAEAEKAIAAKPDPRARYASYDMGTVLTAGIDSWDLKDGTAAVPTTDPMAVLDEETAIYIHEQVLELSLPPEAEAAEEQAKND